MPERLLAISPCRDEAEYVQRTIDSVVSQTRRPDLWIIVDDGSSDDTPRIIASAAKQHGWIRVLTRPRTAPRRVGPGVIEAFYAGLDAADPEDFTHLCKLDVDLDLPSRYFETLLAAMARDPKLGTFSGKPYFPAPNNLYRNWDGNLIPEGCADDMSVGMTKLYRVECFQQIGGFVSEVMWDAIDCHRCRMLGWKAESSDAPELRFIHLRPMGSSHRGILTGRFRHGFGQWFMGTHPAYMLASAVFRLAHRPFVIGGLAVLAGYGMAALRRAPRYSDCTFRRFLHDYQWNILLRGRHAAMQRTAARDLTAAKQP